jgi:hypothetical protein
MSTLATTNIKHPSSSMQNIVLAADGSVNIQGNSVTFDSPFFLMGA